MERHPAEHHDLDAIGLRCPIPVVRLARRALELPAGSVITVRTTDPAARHDLPAWARMRRHTVLSQVEVTSPEGAEPDATVLVTTIRLEPTTGEDRGQRDT